MRLIKLFTLFFLLPGFLLAQELDSLNLKINQLNQSKVFIDSQIDSLEAERMKITNNISDLRIEINKIELENEKEEGFLTKISTFGGKLRDEPSIRGNLIAELEENDEVLIYDWIQKPYVKASYKGKVGYISISSLEENQFIRQIYSQIEQEKIENIREDNPELARLLEKYSRSTAERLLEGEIWIGMTDEMAEDALGYPSDINRTTTAYGVREQWVYPYQKYLYFQDGRLESWQD